MPVVINMICGHILVREFDSVGEKDIETRAVPVSVDTGTKRTN